MSLVLGFDWGWKLIGVAVGQTFTQSARPLTTLKANQGMPEWQSIENLLKEWKPESIVVGLPLNMDGTEQAVTQSARKFAEELQTFSKLPVHLVDERLSTWEAKQRLSASEFSEDSQFRKKMLKNLKNSDSKMKHSQNKDKKLEHDINALSAAIVLEQWLREEKQKND